MTKVHHYTDVLLLPFHLMEKQKKDAPYPNRVGSLQEVSTHLQKLYQQDVSHWQPAPAAIEPVAFDQSKEQSQYSEELQQYHQYQTLAYFHPAVRNFLFGSKTFCNQNQTSQGNDYMHWFEYKKLDKVEITCSDNQTTARFTVQRCSLALFQPNIGVLQLELCAHIDENAPWTLDQVQRLRDEMRRAYPPYTKKYLETLGFLGGGHCPLQVRWRKKNAEQWHCGLNWQQEGLQDHLDKTLDKSNLLPEDAQCIPLFTHWEKWLGPLINPEQTNWTLVPPADDRLPSMAFIAVDDPRTISRGDWIRTCFADAPGTDELPYARNFLHNFEQHYCYDRFWHNQKDSADSPSRIMNCGYAFTMVGSYGDQVFFTNNFNGAYVAFRQVYARMGLVAYFQRTALTNALNRLSILAMRENGELRDYHDPAVQQSIDRLYAEFLEFTQMYWFEEISPQEQGIQLFSMWQRALRTPMLYAEVRSELQDLSNYMQAKANDLQTQASNRLTSVATWIGGLGVIAGLLGMNVWPKAPEWGFSPDWVFWVFAIFGCLVLTVVIGCFSYKFNRKNKP